MENEIVYFDLNRRQLKDGGPQVPQLVEPPEVGGLRLEERLRLRRRLFRADDLVAVRVQGLHEVDDLGLGSDESGRSDGSFRFDYTQTLTAFTGRPWWSAIRFG